MARKFVVSLDLNKNELLNARIQNLGTAPSNPVSGQIYFDTVTNVMYFYSGTAWVSTSGSAEVIQDTVDSMLIAGTGLDKTYNDGAGTLTLDIDSTVTTNDGAQTLTNKTLTSPTVSGLYLSDSSIVFEGTTNNNFETTLSVEDPTADRTLALPNKTGTLATTDDITNAVDAITTTVIEEGSNLYYTDERVDDRVNGLLTAGTGITKTYDDGNGTLTVAVDTNVIATKTYVDEVAQGLHIHASAVAATTANINLATDLENGDVLDGVTLVTGDRILVKNQDTASQNGIYVVQASGAAVRALDFDQPAEVDGGDFIFVTGGTVNDNTGWVQTSTTVATIGTDPIYFTQFSGAGAYTAGNGLTASGTTFNVGAGTGIVVNADDVAIDTTVVARKYATTIGDNSATSFTVTHSLGTKDVIVQVFEEASPYAQVEADVEHSTTSAVVIKFATAPTLNQYRVSVVG